MARVGAPSTGRLLTVEDAAERMSTSVRFVRQLIAERRIEFVKVGRHVRIAESALADFIEAGRVARGHPARHEGSGVMANNDGHRRFGNVRKRESGRYQIRYPGPDGRMRTGPETYARKSDAERALMLTEAAIVAREWTDPERGKVSLGDYAASWIAQRPGLRVRHPCSGSARAVGHGRRRPRGLRPGRALPRHRPAGHLRQPALRRGNRADPERPRPEHGHRPRPGRVHPTPLQRLRGCPRAAQVTSRAEDRRRAPGDHSGAARAHVQVRRPGARRAGVLRAERRPAATEQFRQNVRLAARGPLDRGRGPALPRPPPHR